MISARDLVQSPEWFPLEVTPDGNAVRLVHLDEAGYRQASFLDQRLLAASPRTTLCPADILWNAADGLNPRAHYIFHIGHVGSTLVSRLLGEHERLFCLREPALLRALTDERSAPEPTSMLKPLPDWTSRMGRSLGLFSRTWHPQQRAVIKATSTVSELAGMILAGSDQPAALFLFARPFAYLQGILGGPLSRAEAKALAPTRQRRLLERLGPGSWEPEMTREGELIAMNWLCEMITLYQASQSSPRQVQWVDFDAFLTAPAAGLQQILHRFGVTMPAAELDELIAGPLMRQYSKAPEHAYDAALRQEVLRCAEREHGHTIKQGLRWLTEVASHYPLAAAAMTTPVLASRRSADKP